MKEYLVSSQDPSVDICWGERLNIEWSHFLHLFIQQTFISHLIGTNGDSKGSEEKRKQPMLHGFYVLEGKYS